MNIENLRTILKDLACIAPIFRNESEFQRSLRIKLNDAGYFTQLERRTKITINGKKIPIRVDILAEKDELRTAIELKYIASKVEVNHKGTEIVYGANWGTNMSRFGILKDLHRVGQLVKEGQAHRGYSISIVSVSDAWEKNTLNKNQLGRYFSLHQQRKLERDQELLWHGEVDRGNVGVRGMPPYVPIIVPTTQVIDWYEYSSFNDRTVLFKFLILYAQNDEAVNDIFKPITDSVFQKIPPIRTDSTVEHVKTQTIQQNGIREFICVSGHPKSYWGLRMTCGKGKADGGNYWGNVSNGKKGKSGIVSLKQPAIDFIADAGGDFEEEKNFLVGPNINVGGSNDYIGHLCFPKVDDAFKYLSKYFILSACDSAKSFVKK